jgi:hypothetical protein
MRVTNLFGAGTLIPAAFRNDMIESYMKESYMSNGLERRRTSKPMGLSAC